MNDARFDNLVRLLGTRPTRRQMLKGISAGGLLAAVGTTRAIDDVAAQCLEDGEPCTDGAECCSGECSASMGVCVEMGTPCLPDDEACTDSSDCCSGVCSTEGICIPADNCVPDGEACTDGAECCGGACSASLGVCVTMDDTCLPDGEACAAGEECCSGNCDETDSVCFTPLTTLPATGAGDGGTSDPSVIVPAAVLGAAAVIGARRVRSMAPDETTI
ncbi:MAG: hypothetical protein KC438_10940 [Thermomicrobiales bacterium]|nr:hypothetical protein [Thermomicrobiales bacterium]